MSESSTVILLGEDDFAAAALVVSLSSTGQGVKANHFAGEKRS